MGAGGVAHLSRHGSARVARVLLVAPITPFMLRTAANPDGMDPAIRDLFAAAIEADYPRALRQFAPGFWGEGEEVWSEINDWGHGLALQASLIAAETLLRRTGQPISAPTSRASTSGAGDSGSTTNRRPSINAGGRLRASRRPAHRL
jgi:hypothetical protein